MLCGICTILDMVETIGQPGIIQTVPGVYDWWTQHKLDDEKEKQKEVEKLKDKEKRRGEEVLKVNALAKLTKKERRLLGL